jgi:hypothetical protein
MKWFGRDPAVVLSVIASALTALVAFNLPMTELAVTAVMAILYAGSDVITAFVVKSDKQLPVVIGFAEAILTGLLVFGYDISVEQVAAIMGLVTVAAGMFIRTQVDAPMAKVIPGVVIR